MPVGVLPPPQAERSGRLCRASCRMTHSVSCSKKPLFWMLTASTSMPRSSATQARMASAWGPTFGRSQMTVTSALPTRQPRSRSSASQCRTNARLSAPFQRSSEGGKCLPMSPSASAPSMASHSACSTTSPSLCACTPRACGTRTPPSITWSPSPKAWTSKPWPMRMLKVSGMAIPCGLRCGAKARTRTDQGPRA